MPKPKRLESGQARKGENIVDIEDGRKRSQISNAKLPMLEAALAAIDQLQEFWPLTIRQIHYCLLSGPPLRNAGKPDSIYRNDRASYDDLCDLLSRARVFGRLDWKRITDETRPVILWRTASNVREFVEEEVARLFKHYCRDPLQSQSDHFEIVIEKNSSLSVVEKVSRKYTIAMTSGRGQTCKVRLKEIAERFQASGKARLVLFLLSDFDPAGDAIANANARSLRDDMGIGPDQLVTVRVALTLEQVERYRLPRSLEAKTTSATYEKFVARHGVRFAVELEALRPEDLQAELDRMVRSHIDERAFKAEEEQWKKDAAKLSSLKNLVTRFVQEQPNL